MSFKTLESIPLLFGLGVSSFIFSGSNGTFLRKSGRLVAGKCPNQSWAMARQGWKLVLCRGLAHWNNKDVHDCFPTKYFSISWWQFGDPGSTSETSPVEEPLLKRICFCSTCPQTPGMFRTNTNSSP